MSPCGVAPDRVRTKTAPHNIVWMAVPLSGPCGGTGRRRRLPIVRTMLATQHPIAGSNPAGGTNCSTEATSERSQSGTERTAVSSEL